MNVTDGKREEISTNLGWYVDSDVWMAQDRNIRRRVYDRLRKRSYRRTKAIDYVVRDGSIGLTEWTGYDHEAYVAGVRDALNELPYG